MELTIQAKAKQYGVEFKMVGYSTCQFFYGNGVLGCSLENAEIKLKQLITEKGLKNETSN